MRTEDEAAVLSQSSALMTTQERCCMPRQIGDVVLEVHDLHTHIFTRWGVVRAVDGVSFYLRQGETLGIVGESGCGKTMTALSLLRLVPRPGGRIVQGKIVLEGENLLEKSDNEMRHIRGRRISMILQDPQTSLNPVFYHRQPAHRRHQDSPSP